MWVQRNELSNKSPGFWNMRKPPCFFWGWSIAKPYGFDSKASTVLGEADVSFRTLGCIHASIKRATIDWDTGVFFANSDLGAYLFSSLAMLSYIGCFEFLKIISRGHPKLFPPTYCTLRPSGTSLKSDSSCATMCNLRDCLCTRSCCQFWSTWWQ